MNDVRGGYTYVDIWMDSDMDGWMDICGYVDIWMDGWIYVDIWMDGYIYVDIWMDNYMDG